jgi:RsiW-degrading membrane proteinase PrsW (M82 family)
VTLFMAVAACVGVLQLAVLGWPAGRTVRIGTLLLAVLVGVYACGVVVLALEYLYTRGASAILGQRLSETVRTASYTVDPFIEEIGKVAPLLIVAVSARVRRQWGLTDYVLLGAATGAGFGLLEAVLRVSHRTDSAIAIAEGWVIPVGLSAVFIPDLGTSLTSWLPAPFSAESLAFVTEPETYVHLAWSAGAGLGAGVLLRASGPRRLFGLVPIAYVSAAHAAHNYDVSVTGHSAVGDALATPLMWSNQLLWLLPPACLAVAGVLDRRDIARGRAATADVLLTNDRGALLTFAGLRPPWTTIIATRFVRARRSLFYARGTDADLHDAVRAIRDAMAGSNRREAWRGVAVPAGTFAVGRLLRDWRLWSWLVLAVPTVVYLVVAAFPSTGGLQNAIIDSDVSRIVLPALMAAALLWLAWRLAELIRERTPPVLGEGLARTRLRLLAALAALPVGAYSLWRVVGGADLDDPAIRNFHLLDALAAALLIALVVLVIALAVAAFPPGGLALAGIGGAGGAAVTISGELVLGTAIVGTLSTILLMQANSGGSGSGGDGGSAGPNGPERDGIRLDSTGKVHGRLPNRVPDHWTRSDLNELAADLRTSIRNRNLEQIRLGEDGPHRARIAQEEQLLRQIERILGGR